MPSAGNASIVTDTTGIPSVTISYVLAPSASLAPSGLTFGVLAPGSTSPSQAVTITNDGAENLVVSGVAFGGANPGDFTADNACTTPTVPGATCSLFVRFTPAAGGTRVASLTVNSNSPGTPPTILVTGTGLAVAGPPSPTPTARTLSGLRLTPARFKAAKGTKVAYTASAAGTTTLTVTRSALGRRARARCVALPKKPAPGAKLRRCTRTLTLGTVTRTDMAGENSFTFAARLGGRTLAPGRYTLRAQPGPDRPTTTATFTVIR